MTQEFPEYDKSELPQYDKNTALPHLSPQGTSVTVTVKKKKNLKTVKGFVCFND